jgi:hypothetical protein
VEAGVSLNHAAPELRTLRVRRKRTSGKHGAGLLTTWVVLLDQAAIQGDVFGPYDENDDRRQAQSRFADGLFSDHARALLPRISSIRWITRRGGRPKTRSSAALPLTVNQRLKPREHAIEVLADVLASGRRYPDSRPEIPPAIFEDVATEAHSVARENRCELIKS